MAILEEFSMQRFWIRYFIFIVFLLVFAGISIGLRYNRPAKVQVDISQIPLNVGQWHGKEIPVEKETKDILETDMVLLRRYSNPSGDVVDLAIVYYKDSRVALHLPESCLMGQGSRLTERKPENIKIRDRDSFDAMQLITKSDKVNYLVLYYFEAGEFRTSSYFAFRKQLLWNKLKGKSTSGALVRFSIPVTEVNLQDNLIILKKFIYEMGGLLPPYLK